MKGAGTDEDTLIRIIVCRSEVIMQSRTLAATKRIPNLITDNNLATVTPGPQQLLGFDTMILYTLL